MMQIYVYMHGNYKELPFIRYTAERFLWSKRRPASKKMNSSDMKAMLPPKVSLL
jgi:hypothetical protein